MIRAWSLALLPGASHPLAHPASLHELALQTTDLSVEQIVGLVDHANSYVRNDLKRASLAEFAIILVGHITRAPEAPDKSGLMALFFPDRKVPDSEQVAVIGQEFFQARASNADQLDFRLLGSAGRFAPFHDILFPGSGGLDHLIIRAIRLTKKPLTEPIPEIINHLGLSIGKQFAVVAMRRNETRVSLHRTTKV